MRGDVRVLSQGADNPSRRLLSFSVSWKHDRFHPPCNKRRRSPRGTREDRRGLHQPRAEGNSCRRDQAGRCHPGRSCPNTGPSRPRRDKRQGGTHIREGEADDLRGGSGSGGAAADGRERRGQETCRAPECRWQSHAGGRAEGRR